MNSSTKLKRIQVKKYESSQFNLLQLSENEEYVKLSSVDKQPKGDKIIKSADIKQSPTVYISRVIVQILEGLQQFLISELSFYKIDKNKYQLYWQFLSSSFIFTWIESQIYIQDENYTQSNAFSSQILRISNYFVQASDILLENKAEEIYQNWQGLYDYLEKIINVNYIKIVKHKDKCPEQYFCIGYSKNIITSFKKGEKYSLSIKESETLQEITTSILNLKMRDYLLDDEDAQDASMIQDNQLITGAYFNTIQMRDIQQSAEFNTIQQSQQQQQSFIKNPSSPQNIVSSQNIKESFFSHDNIDAGGGIKNDMSNRQSYQNVQSEHQSLSQFDSTTNNNNNQQTTNYNSSSGLQSNRGKDQNPSILEKDNLSINTNSSNKAKVIQQQLLQQVTTQNIQQNQISTQIQNQKGKRESILLPSSQFEFQSNIKNGGVGQHLYSTNGSNQNNQQQDNSYSSQFLCKEDDIFNQNGEAIVINNGFFSRKVSDNLLDDLDQIAQEESPTNQQSQSSINLIFQIQLLTLFIFDIANKNFKESQYSQSQLSQNSSNSSLHSAAQKSDNNADLFSGEKKSRLQKIEKVQEIKLKKNSQDSMPNGRTREFSFKCDLLESKKDGSVKTINDIENYINKELMNLNKEIEKLSNENSYNPEYIQQQEGFNPTRSSLINAGSRKSKVRGSNLPSDISAYELHSSRVDDDNSNTEQDDSETNNSQHSSEVLYNPYQGFNRNRKDKIDRYIAAGVYNNDEIIMDQIEDEEDYNDESSSFENKVPYTRNRSNVYVQNQFHKNRASHGGDMPRSSFLKKENQQGGGRKVSKFKDNVNLNQEMDSESFQNNTENITSENQTTPLDEYEQDHFDILHELDQMRLLTQEELDQIREDVHNDISKVNINLDNTMLGKGIAKNYKKYKFPLQISFKDNSYKRKLQEKYKLIQNYQHLLSVDSNIFAADQTYVDQTRKVVLANNKEFLKMMNKLPEDEQEKYFKKKKSIEEVQAKYQQRKYSKKIYKYQTSMLGTSEMDVGSEIIQEETGNENKGRRESNKMNIVSIKKNIEQPDYNILKKRKSQEQMQYNVQEDEIDEEDNYFHDQSGIRGFSHQIYAINKHNYFKEFKEQATQEILQQLSDTMETFQKELKEEEQKERSEQIRNKQESIYDFRRSYEENKLPSYNLNLEINEKCIRQPLSQLSQQYQYSQYSWNRARIEAEEKKIVEMKTISPNLQPLKFKKSVLIQEDQLNEMILRQKNLSSSPTKKQNLNAKKARKRSGSFNPEANNSSEDENQFTQSIKKFQSMFHTKSMTLTFDKSRLSLKQ